MLLSGGLTQVNLISGIQDTTSVPIIKCFTSLPPNLKKMKVQYTTNITMDNGGAVRQYQYSKIYCDTFIKNYVL